MKTDGGIVPDEIGHQLVANLFLPMREGRKGFLQFYTEFLAVATAFLNATEGPMQPSEALEKEHPISHRHSVGEGELRLEPGINANNGGWGATPTRLVVRGW